MAEKNASKISSYKVKADGIDIGRFKSSGIIISTGTGSTGWLYGAKRVTAKEIQMIAQEIIKRHTGDQNEALKSLKNQIEDNFFSEEVANQMSKDTQFSQESKRMYYYVREPYNNSQNSEGYARSLEVQSELLDGEICIDGLIKVEVNNGDKVVIENSPDFSLRSIQFIM